MKANEVQEIYPIQFIDKIDEYLWKEHHIIGGCCSSIESLKYTIAREVSEKLTDAFIEKACEFLKSYRQEIYDGMGYIAGIINDETIEDFKKYMKGEEV